MQREWPAARRRGLVGPGSVTLTWGVVVLFRPRRLGAGPRVGIGSFSVIPPAPQLCPVRLGKFPRCHVHGLMLAFVLLVCQGRWGWFIGERFVSGEIVWPGVDFILLSPLFVGLMLTWAANYSLERALALSSALRPADDFPSRWNYVALQTRHNFILVAPPLLLMFLQQTILAIWPDLLHNRLVLPLIGLGLLGSMYAGVPWLLRLLLGLVPMPPGMLRDRLMATARRLSFPLQRHSDLGHPP